MNSFLRHVSHRLARRPIRPHSSRGQALAEMAIILPVLVLFVLLALDFGRVFFGWVTLNNAVRVAANNAAVHADAWSVPVDGEAQDRYRVEVLNELQGVNCSPPVALDTNGNSAWDVDEIPDPQFINKPATSFSAAQNEVGDHAAFGLTCEFSFLTPLVGAIVGDPMPIGAAAEFPIRGGEVLGVPIDGSLPSPPACSTAFVPDMVGMSVATARQTWFGAGFNSGTFTPGSGSDSEIVSAQVTNPSSSPGDCSPLATTVVVAHSEPSPCSGPNERQIPAMIGLTLANARTAWADAEFDPARFNPATGNDTNVVTGQSIVQGACRDITTTSITVTHDVPPTNPPSPCTAPQLVAQRVNAGQTAWTNAGFAASNYFITRPPSGNYVVTSQSLVGGQQYPCTTTITVAGN